MSSAYLTSRMQPLLERGRASCKAAKRTLGEDDAVVTLDDFVAAPRLCHQFAVRVKPLLVFDDTENECAVVKPA